MQGQTGKDRREHVRYNVNSGIFIVLKPQLYSAKLGSMIDISNGGLSFQYYSCNDLSFRHLTEVDIYKSGDGKILEGIPVTVVSGMAIPFNDPYFSATIKRFGVQFGEITHETLAHLQEFISKFTETD